MTSDAKYRHKWWGWGPDGVEYDMQVRPFFWPWICKTAHLSPDTPTKPPVDRRTIILPQRRAKSEFETVLLTHLARDQVRDDDDDRLTHAYGRSYRDLVRLRAGIIDRAPDLIVYPTSHEEVVQIVQLAVEHNVCLVPFGGGTNIVGSVEPDGTEQRFVVTLDMRRMTRLISIDQMSQTAVMEPGMFGPRVEEALRAHGFSLGHHPDSFVYSTLGGWLATRSAGTQSNVYGKIEDMVVAMRVVTPRGTIDTKPHPAASTGPDLNRLLVGSEGTLGVITQATMRIHPIPEIEEYRMLLFRSFEQGYVALHECTSKGLMPSMARLSDEAETELMFAAQRPPTGIKKGISSVVKKLLAARGYTHPAALVVAFEGNRDTTPIVRRGALKTLKRHEAFDLGKGPGEAWKESRYDVPYLRDYMMDYGIIADSFETSTSWSNLMPLYHKVQQIISDSFVDVTGFTGYVGAHVSHLYDTGACLYFTIGVRASEGATPNDMIDQYATIKHTATEAIVRHGGALSHHHAVGYEHRPWIEREMSPLGLQSLRKVKQTLDPTAILNPGALIPPDHQ